MEISERELHQMVREVDELNSDGMETMSTDIAELHSGEGRRLMGLSRRRFVQGVGLGGVTLAIGGAMIPLASMWNPAYAQASDDKSIAAFAESVELAAVAAYGAAAKTGKVTGAALTVAKTFSAHHQAHAGAFGGFAGDSAKAQPNPKLVATIAPMIQSAADQTAILKIAYGLENSAAATYLFAIGALTDPTALKATASILPVESQHAVVLGHVLGMAPGDDKGTYIPAFITTDPAVKPDQFPIASGT
ncbi:MAG: ferritin-like domain-containing protein [Actinomycetota bacterium]|nr:ferritin-like domain-containing protein [Actinomycetota bacterium]